MKVDGQLGLDESVIEDEALEAALEARWSRRESARATAKAYREADTEAKAHVERAVPVDVVARVGRFRIERKRSIARHVEFDTQGKVRIAIEIEED